MIIVTRLDDNEFLINELFVERIEETPDTVVTMQNGHRYIVKETISQIMQKIYPIIR